MALSIRDYTIIKVIQVTHHQGDVRFCRSRVIQWSFVSLISVSWTFVKYLGLWNKFDLDYILRRGYQMFKCTWISWDIRLATSVLDRKLLYKRGISRK